MAANDSAPASTSLEMEVAELRQKLLETEQTLEAIRSGEIDALIVDGESGNQVFMLKGAEHGYRLFVEGMHEGAVTLRADGLVLHCNARFASLLELPLSRVTGAHLLDFVDSGQAQILSTFLQSSGDRRQEFELLSASGQRIPVMLAVSAALVDEATGGMCLIVTDLREQRHMEQLQITKTALEQSQDQLRLALETARLGSWKYVMTTGDIECSAQCLANLGRPPHYPLNRKTIFQIILPEDRTRIQEEVGRSLAAGDHFECEFRVVCPDASVRWALASGHVLRDTQGTPFEMVGVSLDITSRRAEEETLKQSESRFRTLAEAIPQLSWTCLPSGECEFLSQQWIDYTGIPAQQQLGYGWMQTVHPDDRERTERLWHDAVANNGEYDLEFRIRAADGTYRWFKTRGAPVRDDRGQVIRWFGTCTEVEDIVQARQILNRDKAQLEELVLQRTASLNEATEQLNSFCYSVAHDLRAPLRAQQGYARIILEDFGEQIGPSGQQFAERIVVAAERLEKLVNDLLSHVSISRGDQPMQRVDIAAVVAQVRADLSETIQQSKASLQIGSLDGFVLAHGPSLNLIVANLVSNALKYTKPDQPPQVKIWAESNESTIRLWVEDDGIGIKPEYHEKIFGVFQRLHTPESYPGTGIGLALVRKGVERMGGRVGVISAPGAGSKFWITLPKYEIATGAD